MKKSIALLLLVCVLCSAMLPLAPQVQAAGAWNNDGTLSVLAIGNSFSEDTLAYVWNIAKDLGVSDIVIGNLSAEDGAIADHWLNAKEDKAAYTYYINTDGNWSATDDCKMSSALTSRNWDFVVMQQLSDDSGREETYNSDLTNLVSYVKGICPTAKLVWNMTWAYQEGSEKLQNSVYADQLDMHHRTVSAVMNKIATNGNFDVIVPISAAAQNTRTSLIRDNICDVDGYHLGKNFGRYLAGLTFVGAITGLDVWQCQWTPEDVPFAWQVIAMESVSNALCEPFAITDSQHPDVETSLLYDTDPTKSQAAPSGDSAYARIYPKWTKGGYWQSTSADSPTKIITNKSNSPYYWCTLRYTKTYLPVGTVIMLSSGYQYRMDAWKSEATQASRPGNSTAAHKVVTDADWNGYTYRAFNISSTTANTDITNLSAETINNAFKLYYPVGAGNLDNVSKYVRIKHSYTKNEYWYCTHSTYWSRTVTAKDKEGNETQFFCTPQYTKDTLPNGSIIYIDGAWEWRSDCWNGDAKWSGDRPHMNDEKYVRISDAFWRGITKRAFNVRRDDKTLISKFSDETLQDVFRIYLPASAHTHSNSTQTTDSTCSKTGTKVTTCSTCYYSKTETIPMKAHTVANKAAVAPTCTTTGLTAGTYCSVCNATITAQTVVEALGHTEVVDAAAAPNCTETGLTEGKHCSVCNEVLLAQETVPATGHTEIIDAAVEPNCTETGLTEGSHCSVCGEIIVEQKELPAAGHIEVIDKAIAPTCTETGLTEGKHCETCGEVFTTQEIVAATGHLNTTTTVVEGSCTEDGSITVTCNDCGEVVSSEIVAGTGHSYSKVVIAPSCVERGYDFNFCICGDNYKDNWVAALGHSYNEGEITKAPTCTEEGTRTLTCHTCGKTATEAVAATGHVNISTKTTEATCTESGSIVVACACGEIISREEIPALGHSYGTPADNNDGTHTATCACGDAITENHNFVEGSCICGAVEVTEPVLDSSLSFGANLVLENDLTMKFRVRSNKLTSYDISTAYILVQRDVYATGAKEPTVETTVISDYTVEGDRLVFSYPGIAAAQMNDNITATLYIKNAKGKEYVGPALETSVTANLNGLLGAYAADAKMVTLIMDMVNYGAAAQIYFDRHTDALANEAYENFITFASYASADFTTVLENLSTTENTEGKSGKLNLGLDLGTRIGIQYKVTVPANVNVEDVSLVVTDASGNVLETLTVAGNATDNKGRYIVNFYGNTSTQMRRMVYATAYANGEAITGTYGYTVSTYAWGVQENASLQPAELVNVTRAMMLYGDSAANYFG